MASAKNTIRRAARPWSSAPKLTPVAAHVPAFTTPLRPLRCMGRRVEPPQADTLTTIQISGFRWRCAAANGRPHFWIAHTPLSIDAVLVTTDRAFRLLQGLSIEDWPEESR